MQAPLADLHGVDWVFAYGSLIWDPDFDFQRAEPGRLHGLHRAFCIQSRRYRGTPEAPGVVLGLDRGGSCTGLVYQFRPATRAESLHRLFAREMPDEVYRAARVQVRPAGGQTVTALTFVANHRSPAYARLDEAEILRRLRECCGARGRNRDYAVNTMLALRDRGIRDGRIESLVGRLE